MTEKKIHQTHFQVPDMPWKKDKSTEIYLEEIARRAESALLEVVILMGTAWVRDFLDDWDTGSGQPPRKKEEPEGEMGYLKNTAFQYFLDLRYALLVLAGDLYNCLRDVVIMVRRLTMTDVKARAKEARDKALEK